MTLKSHLRKDVSMLLRDRWGLAIALALPAIILVAYGRLELRPVVIASRNPEAFILVISTVVPVLLVASTALVNERRLGTFRRLARSPASIAQVVASKTIASLTVLAPQVLVILVSAIALFGERSSGVAEHTGSLAIVLLVAGLSAQALGVFVSSLVSTEAQAMQLTALVFLLMFTLSGFLQPLDQIGGLGIVAGFSPLALGYSGASLAIADGASAGASIRLAAVTTGLVIASSLVSLIRR